MIYIVDLDKTLIPYDTTFFSLNYVLKNRPLSEISKKIIKGKSNFKKYINECVDWNIANLFVSEEVYKFLILKKKHGHKLFLISGSDNFIVSTISKRFGIFDLAIGSNEINPKLKYANKLKYIKKIAGKSEWAYLADAYQDSVIWHEAQESVLVSNSRIKFFIISIFMGGKLTQIKPGHAMISLPNS